MFIFAVFSYLLPLCSVGGTGYGSVRVGTFMGRKIIKSEASALVSYSLGSSSVPQDVNDMNSNEYEEQGMALLKTEASRHHWSIYATSHHIGKILLLFVAVGN